MAQLIAPKIVQNQIIGSKGTKMGKNGKENTKRPLPYTLERYTSGHKPVN